MHNPNRYDHESCVVFARAGIDVLNRIVARSIGGQRISEADVDAVERTARQLRAELERP